MAPTEGILRFSPFSLLPLPERFYRADTKLASFVFINLCTFFRLFWLGGRGGTA